MSFSESITAGGFNQKTIKEDLFVKENHGYPRRNQLRKTPEHYIRQTTATGTEPLTCGASRPHLQADRPVGPMCQPLLRMSVLHQLKDQI